jgi:hypothetical protein
MSAGSLLLHSHVGLLLNLAATITPRDENLHPNIPRNAEKPKAKFCVLAQSPHRRSPQPTRLDL